MPGFDTVRAFICLATVLTSMAISSCDKPSEAKTSASTAQTDGGPERLKVAFVYVGPAGDGGWTYAHDQARRQLEAQFGDRITTSAVENVPEGPEAEKVFRQLAQEGNALIFGTTFGYGETMLKVAKDFPKVKFEHATGNTTAANVSTYEARTYEGAYMAGIIAGKMTRTNKLGFVASVKIPEVIRNINAFTLGAQSVNTKVSTSVVWVDKWFDPDKEATAANELIKGGADILIQNTDSPAVLETAQEKGIMAFGWDSDMTQYGPKAHLGSAAIDWAPYYKREVSDVLNGSWKPGSVWWGVHEASIKISSPNPTLPKELILFVGERMIALRTGSLKPFQGPIQDQSGKEVIAAGTAPDDTSLRNMHFLVQGVKGKL